MARDSKETGSRARARKLMVDIYGKIPSNCVVHHVDGNPYNNDISNLQIMNKSYHASYHNKGIKKFPPSKVLQITLPDETYESLEARSAKEKLRPATLVTVIVRKVLEEKLEREGK